MTDWDHDVDVVVLGSGGAGLTSALSAAANGASVEIYEKAATVGGTTAVSGGIIWIPAHDRAADGELTVEDAMAYLRAQSLGYMDDDLVETFVRTGPEMLDFVEAHSDLRFEVAEGFRITSPSCPAGDHRAGARSTPSLSTWAGSASGATASRRFRRTSAMSASTRRPGHASTPRWTTNPVTTASRAPP